MKSAFLSPLRSLKARTGLFSAVRQPDLTDGWIRPAVAWACGQGPWDAVVSSGGPPAAHLAALQLRQRTVTRRWAADFRDLWLDNHLYSGLFPFTIAERRRERRVLGTADQLVTVSPGLARRLAVKSDKPVAVIYNGYDPEGLAEVSPAPAFPADGRMRLVYTGTVYPAAQDVQGLCAAVAGTPAAILVVASDRPEVWLPMAKRFGLGDRLDFRGSIPRPEALRLQRDASALVLLDWNDPRAGVLTGKVFEYLVSPAPIWVVGGTLDSPAARLVQEANRGTSFGHDVGRLRAAILAVAEGRGNLAGEPNREFIAGLSRAAQARRLLDLLDGMR